MAYTDEYDYPDLDSTTIQNQWYGNRFTVNVNGITSIKCYQHTGDNYTDLKLVDADTETVLQTESVSGDSATMTYDFVKGKSYYLMFAKNTNNTLYYSTATFDWTNPFNTNHDTLTITGRVNSGDQGSNYTIFTGATNNAGIERFEIFLDNVKDQLIVGAKFYSTLGADAIDISGNGNHGTHSNVSTASSTSDLTDDSLAQGQWSVYNGSTSYTNIPDDNSLDITDKVTWDFYFTPDTLSQHNTFIAKFDFNTDACYYITLTTSNIFRVGIADSATSHIVVDSASPPSLSVGTTYHCEIVYDGSQTTNIDRVKVYINNSEITMGTGGTIPTSLRVSAADINIGYFNGLGRVFNGNIKDIGIYNRALTTDERTQRYNSGAGYRPNWLKEHCVFYMSVDTNANDSTPNENDGTVTGATNESGKLNNCYDFDGNDYITVGDATELNLGSDNQYSISMWQKLNSTSQSIQVPIGKYTQTGSDYGWLIFLSDRVSTNYNHWELYHRDSSGLTDAIYETTSITDTNWHYFTSNRFGTGVSNMNINRDGSISSVTTVSNQSASSVTNTESMLIGKRIGDVFYSNAKFDEVALFKIPLANDLHRWLYNSGSPTTLQQYPFEVTGPTLPILAKKNGVDINTPAKWNGTANTNISKFIGFEKALPPAGQEAFTTPGTTSFTAPTGVTSVSVVCVGGGGAGYGSGSGGAGGGAGALGYKNNITVTPGNSYTVVVGSGGTRAGSGSLGNSGGDSYFIDTSTVKGGGGVRGTATVAGTGGTYTGDGGGNGGAGGVRTSYAGSGGGAGGYSGAGGAGANQLGDGSDGTGGSAGGGSTGGSADAGGAGGGVGILGEGTSGTGGAYINADGNPGTGGSGGATGTQGGGGAAANGGAYGGGGAGADSAEHGSGGQGAVRVIWGTGRSFPSTNTEDV